MPYVQVGELEVYTEIAGVGEPVLVLHGGFCSLESVRPLVGALARGRRVHAYERPGHGRTPDVAGEYDYQVDVAAAVGYLDAHGLGQVHVVGLSDGGIIGLLLAIEHPQRVRSLVAVSANLTPSAFDPTPEHGRALTLLTGAELDAAPLVDAERAAYARLSPDGPDHADIVLNKLDRLWRTQPQISPDDLHTIAAPTLVLSGDRDSVPVQHSLLIAASIRRSQLGVLPGTTHGLADEKPGLLATLVADFLDTSVSPRVR